MSLKLKKFTTKFRKRVGAWQFSLGNILLDLVLILLVLSLVVVGRGNHALYYNTKYFESTELLYETPDFYSLSDMRVDIDSTYYSIEDVVYVFRSVGTQFNRAEGILTQGYVLGMYEPVLWVVGVVLLYITLELLKSLSAIGGIREKIRSRKWWGRGFILACVLFLILVAQLLLPLL